MKVLVVEDDQALARGCVRVLTANGHEARYSVSTDEAREAILEMDPDVLIVDLMLEDSKDPCLTMERITEHLDINRVPVVVFSAYPLDQEKCVEKGCSEFLLKGEFTPMDMPAAVERAVGRHGLISALNRREAMVNGDMTWPGGGDVEPDKVGDRMISLGQELRAAAAL